MGAAEYLAENRRYWDGAAELWVASGERLWAAAEPSWGIWGLPEPELNLLPRSMEGLRAVELGCGTGYVSGWMVRRGARVVGIDNSSRQLQTARRLAAQHGVCVELVHGDAEHVPARDARFDFAISEYGAAIWCDPEVWIPEAYRVLRPGGQLVFLGHHPLLEICSDPDGESVGEALCRSYFELHCLDWRGDAVVDPGGVEFGLPISRWMRLFREVGFVIEDYLELPAPRGARNSRFGVNARWAQRWPCEQVWKLRKPSAPPAGSGAEARS